jgi:hypothetical protein
VLVSVLVIVATVVSIVIVATIVGIESVPSVAYCSCRMLRS